jgi:hypothetical protein
MERLIFGEFVKRAENPCRKRFDVNSETSSRHISGTVADIATTLQTGVPRATVYFPADFHFQSFNGLFLAIFCGFSRPFWNANNSKTVNAINPLKLRLLRRSPRVATSMSSLSFL